MIGESPLGLLCQRVGYTPANSVMVADMLKSEFPEARRNL